MNIVEKNQVIAKFMNDAIVPHYNECWNALMNVANKLVEIEKSKPVSFNKNDLSFDIEIFFENVFEYILWLKKYELEPCE